MPRRRIVSLTVGTALAVSIVSAPVASADTVTMGSMLANDYQGGVSTSATTTIQYAYDPGTSPNPTISPANGLITGWKVKSGDPAALYTLKVMRPNAAVNPVPPNQTSFMSIASVTAPEVVPGTAAPTGTVFEYPASLPISQGDYLGLEQGGLPDVGIAQNTTSGIPANVFANQFSGGPADGQSADFQADAQHDLLLQATVKFCKVPNLKGKKAKAAKKALLAADCAAKVKKKTSKKKKNRGRVTKQKTAAGTTAAPGTVVPIVVGKK